MYEHNQKLQLMSACTIKKIMHEHNQKVQLNKAILYLFISFFNLLLLYKNLDKSEKEMVHFYI